MSAPAAVCRPRNPQSSDYYRRIEDHFETFIQVYEERFERLYGFFLSYLQKVIYRYLDCDKFYFHYSYLLPLPTVFDTPQPASGGVGIIFTA
ncbi:MAG: hypothetical protein ABSG75_11800 [Syntrophales bacterium]|jgi:hypothetical protein